jgi:dATP pyrophosphohydrolase
MPEIVADIVDVYVFRRLNARVQFLLLQRKANVPLGNTWQSFHTQIRATESTIAAARRAVRELAGLNISEVYSADYINEFYDDTRDVVVLAPVLAVQVSPQAPVTLGPELKECSWFDATAARARLPFAGQRWAVRHINELMGAGLAESQLYRLQLPDESLAPAAAAPGPAPDNHDDLDDAEYGNEDPFNHAPGDEAPQETFDRDVPDEIANDEPDRPYDRA